MSKKIIYDESLDSEIQFKKFVATQAPENHEISDEDVEHMEMANLIDLEIQDHENFMNQVRDSYCEYDSYDDYLIEEQYMDKIEEPFDLEQEYDKWDDYSDCIDSDLEYKEYQQEQFRKEDSIEGPMSCFEHGYYMDESSNSNHEEPPFIEEYDFDELKMELEYEKNSYLVENEVTPEDIMSERIEEHKKEEKEYMDMLTFQQEDFNPFEYYPDPDAGCNDISIDAQYFEYKQAELKKENSIEGPMSCFEHGYYMDESSNSNHEEPPFIEEYDFDELKMELEYEKNSYLVENEVTPEDIMSERIEEHKKEEKEYMDMLTFQQEDFNPFEYYPDPDAGCNDISIDAQYFEYKQAELKKENSIEGPMSCFEHGYYMDGPSDSDYEDLSFMEEYDFEDNLTFEMKEEIYGPDFESELQEDKEKEFKKN